MNARSARLRAAQPVASHAERRYGRLQQGRQPLIAQKPLNKFYWSSEYSQMQPAFKSGDIWIAYTWQDTYVAMKNAGVKVAYMNPHQGKLSCFGGFVLGSQTKNYFHAHSPAGSLQQGLQGCEGV